MEICNLPRGGDKTSYLIQRSHVTRYPILCTTNVLKNSIEKKAREMKIDIPQPISVSDLQHDRGILNIKTKLLIDELPSVLFILLGHEVDTVSFTI